MNRKLTLSCIGLAVGGLAIGAAIAFIIPVRYRSTAMVFFQDYAPYGAEAHGNLMALYYTSTGAIMSRTSLSGLMQNLDLYRSERDSEPIGEVVERMRADLKAEIVSPGDRFMTMRIAFTYPDRLKAQAMVSAVMKKYVAEQFKYQNGDLPGYGEAGFMGILKGLEARVAELEHHAGKTPGPAVSKTAIKPISVGVLEPASLPIFPVYPNRPAIVGAGAAAGVLAAMALYFFRRKSVQTTAP